MTTTIPKKDFQLLVIGFSIGFILGMVIGRFL